MIWELAEALRSAMGADGHRWVWRGRVRGLVWGSDPAIGGNGMQAIRLDDPLRACRCSRGMAAGGMP